MEKDKPLLNRPKSIFPFSASASKTINKDLLLFSTVCLLALFLLLVTVLNTLHSNNQYVYLASSFVHGRLDFIEKPHFWEDTSLYAGKYYWPQGPLPAILLIPLYLIFNFGADTGLLGIVLTLLTGLYLYKLARVLGVSSQNARWLSFAFIFATSFCYVNYYSTWAWYFANVLAVFLMVVAVYEWYTRKRFILIGLLIGLSMATRPLTVLAVLSFGWLLLKEPLRPAQKIRSFMALLLPIGVVGLLLLLYNYARFGSFLEFGYKYQIVTGIGVETLKYGVWSIRHIPMNLYYMFLKGFDAVYIPGSKVLQPPFIRPDIWGTSILFTSPILLSLIRAPKNNPVMRVFLWNALLIWILTLMFWSTGMVTYGSRYILDFFALLFPAFVTSFRNPLSTRAKAVIVSSFLFNFVMSLLVFTNL